MRASPQRPRRGLVSVVMLIGLIILGVVAASLLKVAGSRRTLSRIAENRLQAAALADSGLERAIARLRTHPDYPGEVWEIPTSDLGERGPARIQIDALPDPDHPQSRRVVVVADFLTHNPSPVRQSRMLSIPLPPAPR